MPVELPENLRRKLEELREQHDDLGRRLIRWDDVGPPQPIATGVALATRLVGGGQVALLLGAPDGAVLRVDVATGEIQGIPDVRMDPSAFFATLP